MPGQGVNILEILDIFILFSSKIRTLDISTSRVLFLCIPTNNRFIVLLNFFQFKVSKLMPHYCFNLYFSDDQYFCWPFGCTLVWTACSYLPVFKLCFSCLTQLFFFWPCHAPCRKFANQGLNPSHGSESLES